jgi:hypothetical protein
MPVKLEELQKREPILDSLPLPMGKRLKARYRNIQSRMQERELTPLHEIVRERLDALLSEIEDELAKSG